jgi:hypothetical protein
MLARTLGFTQQRAISVEEICQGNVKTSKMFKVTDIADDAALEE